MHDPSLTEPVEGTMDERRAATVSTLAKTGDGYESLCAQADDRGDPSSTTPSRERHDQIKQGLLDLTPGAESQIDVDEDEL